MSRTQVLKLSTQLCHDFRIWLAEAVHHHDLSKDQLMKLNDAVEIIDQATAKLVDGRAQ